MPRNRLWLAVGATAAVLTVGGVGVAVAATSPSSDVTATFSKDSDWGSGYQARFTIANRGSGAADTWKVEFDLASGSSVGTFWDSVVTRAGNHYTAAARDYNAKVAAGASTSFGFIVTGNATPTGCKINGAACTGGGGNPNPSPTATSQPSPTGKPSRIAEKYADTQRTPYKFTPDVEVKAGEGAQTVDFLNLKKSD